MTSPIDRISDLFQETEHTPDLGRHLQNLQAGLTDLLSTIESVFAVDHAGADESGAVEVVINGHGEIKSLKITARGMAEHDHETLGLAVVAAINNAYLAMGEYMRTEFSDTIGEELPDQPAADWESMLDIDFRNPQKYFRGPER